MYVCNEETRLYYLNNRYYNEIICRFINADTVIGKGTLLSHNIFAYCLCNPIIYSDESGHEVKINVYNNDFSTIADVDIGHVDVSINGTIYTFGRYGESWGPLNALGEGILFVGKEDFFIEQQRDKRDVARFTLNLTNEQEQRFTQFFDLLVASGEIISTIDKGLASERTRYRFPKDHAYYEYNLIFTNCTTVTVDALQYALGEECPFTLTSVFIPSELYNTLRNEPLKKYVKKKEMITKK